MTTRPKTNLRAQFKARLARGAIRGVKMPAESAAQFDVYPQKTTERNIQLLERAEQMFGQAARRPAGGGESAARKDPAMIAGEQFLEDALTKAGTLTISAH